MMTFAALTSMLHAQWIGGDVTVRTLSTDSRKLKPGDVFVALRGEHFDGHTFLSQAIANGASAVVVDVEQPELSVPQLIVSDTCVALGQIAAHKRSLFKGLVIGVTGSSGKTSVKGMLRSILSVANDVVVTPGNFNNHIGVPLSLMQLEQQTHAVIELGTSHPGEIAYLADLVQPDIALVNNVMPAHIGGFGSLDAIAEEKSAIYKNLTSQQWAIVNADDDFSAIFENKAPQSRKLGFSTTNVEKNYALLRAENVRPNGQFGVSFNLLLEADVVVVELQVPGMHSVKNALAAAACALAAGCSLSQIAQGLALFTGEAGRMQRKSGRGGACIIDDTYNANPGSVKAAVDYLASCPGKRILVLGDLGELGEMAAQVHQDLGAYARQQQLDAVYACGQFSAQTAQGFGERGVAFDVKQTMVDVLLKLLDRDTTILIKGSRSSHMEDVVTLLCQSEGAGSC